MTGANGSATLEFADKSRLLIHADSELVMDTLSTYGDSGMVDTRLRLPAGRVETQVTPKKGPGSRYEIITPTAVAAVRGTDFRVSAEPHKPVSRSEVLEGKVNVTAEKQGRDIPSGYGTVTEKGKPPIEPIKLLPPPEISHAARTISKLPVIFNWKGVNDAVSYRAQLFLANDFDTLLVDRQVTSASIQLSDLKDNEYTIRVRAIDELGLEGINQDHHFTVNAMPTPPTVESPLKEGLIREVMPVFSWLGVENTKGYHIQIAEDENFRSILADATPTDTNQYQPKIALPEKNLYWRIASVDINGFDGPFSEAMMFTIRPLPGIPEFTRVEENQGRLYFEWRKTGTNINYHFEIATDSHFENIYWQTTTTATRVVIPSPTSNIYYYRIKARNNHGDDSGYNQPTLIHTRALNYNTSTQP